MSSPTAPPAAEDAMSRHDLRNVTEAFLSVQASTSELLAYCRELVAPSDGTVAEVVEVLTPSANDDLRTLQRAVARFIEVVDSLRGYVRAFGAASERQQQRARLLELTGAVALFIERMLIKHRTRQYEAGAALAAIAANSAAAVARELDALSRQVAESFGYTDGRTLADDDASSSEDSDYAPEHDDDNGDGLLAAEDDEAPAAKRPRGNGDE